MFHSRMVLALKQTTRARVLVGFLGGSTTSAIAEVV